MAGLATVFGSGAMTNSTRDLSGAAAIFAIGTNTTEAHPIVGLEVKEAVERGAKLIVANPKEIDLCRFAHLFLQHRHGSDVALLMGMARVIVDEGLADEAFIRERCQDFDAFRASLEAFDLATAERITGVPGAKIAEAARLYASRNPAAIIYCMGITQHVHGTDNVWALANLALLTGNLGKPSSGVNPLRGQSNVQGACDMGALPNVYPGYQAVADPAAKAKFEAAWGVSLSDRPGLTHTEIFGAAHDGRIKALYIVGENPVLSEADANHAVEAMERVEFLVVQDLFLTETAELADVVLPAASFAEKDGTFVNTERRVQRVRRAIDPVGGAKPDSWIVCELAQRLGAAGFDHQEPAQVFRQIASLVPAYAGITYERLEGGGIQWPCPTPEHPGTPILHTERFGTDTGKGKFRPLAQRPPGETPDAEYPLLLTTDRNLFHFHGTMTRRVYGLNVLNQQERVNLHPDDAASLGIADGDIIRVVSRRGEVEARALVTEECLAGTISMSFHFTEARTNVLTCRELDPVAKIPGTKVCAVRVEKAPRA